MAPDSARLAAGLIRWFRTHARDLPWRRTLDPYAIWVSEIMLQQTQVKTVIPYWERWMRALPTTSDLARADEMAILKLWEGLGYYTRVRNLQKAARLIQSGHAGVFPREPEQIRALPGIGRYTAGAIASIAFDLPEPILDGNVIRVLSRVFVVPGNPKDKAVNDRLWALAGELVRSAASGGKGLAIVRTDPLVFAGRRSRVNQGLMELGATVCLPAAPKCPACPLRRQCGALATGRVAELPETAKRARSSARWFHVFVVSKGGRFLVRQRVAGEVNAGFWEFPGVEVDDEDAEPAESFRRLFGEAAEGLEAMARLRHSVTRYRFQQTVLRVNRPARRKLELVGAEWVSLAELRSRPFYSSQSRLLDCLA